MPANAILSKMLERLYASLMRGPGLNCRPHHSRQRIDVTSLTALKDLAPAMVLPMLLDDDKPVRLDAKVDPPANPPNRFEKKTEDAPEPDDPHLRAWDAQKKLLTKLRHLSEDAKTYEQDTGVGVLNIGYPLLSLPPGSVGGSSGRILAPIAFVPVSLEVSTGRKAGLTVTRRADGLDMVTPNPALLAWLERETGNAPEVDALFNDEEGEDPWREIAELVRLVAGMLDIEAPPELSAWVAEATTPPGADESSTSSPKPQAPSPPLTRTPDTDALPNTAAIVPGAVLGMFPMSNQGLLRDTRKMIETDALDGPVTPFIDVGASLAADEHDVADAGPAERRRRTFADERFVALADPCQARAVARSRTDTGLVLHGPPGTGKSQTITNIIGDHLARGERVLFVCDKRTALDVVYNRLDHLGLGGLCALVHDPQRDQRHLYMSIRARLEELSDTETRPRAASRVEKIDTELQRLHDELTTHHDALMVEDADGHPFHELVGRWLSIDAPTDAASETLLRQASLDDLDRCRQDLVVILTRACEVEHAHNPWSTCLGTTLDAFLSRSMDELRQRFASLLEDGRAADATADADIPPFETGGDVSLADQAAARVDLADRLDGIAEHVDETIRSHVAAMPAEDVKRQSQAITDATSYREAFAAGPLDSELHLATRGSLPNLVTINQQLADLEYYLEKMARWYSFICFGAKSAGKKVMRAYGLSASVENAERLRGFLAGLRARIVLSDLLQRLGASSSEQPAVVDDEALDAGLEQYDKTFAAVRIADTHAELADRFRGSLTDAQVRDRLLSGLRKSPARAEALTQLELSFTGIDLFDADWLAQVFAKLRGGTTAGELLTKLEQRFDTIEPILRIRDGLDRLPVTFRDGAKALLEQSLETDAALATIEKTVLAGACARRIETTPTLKGLDEQRLASAFDRYRELEDDKRRLVRDAILHDWVTKQKSRLLAGTGTRLNSDGADLRRRLFTRGRHAMRLRQVVSVGERIAGGDPLFDMCPVWLASPETVAQVFPRKAMFDVVVFDEASQCKLEEALPVLTRAHRVVIAGDPKQLPPTRFFEASITGSDDDFDTDSDQGMFEAQQGEVEDLLNAALNLDIEQSYLDVHYRSRNADLIAFSNENFYHGRLQAVPGHPSNVARFAPLTLHRADGVYQDRCNPTEAERVVDLVSDLLKRAEPPSIGIACFNLKQRDLVSDRLDARAEADDDFARRLAKARSRTGDGSFEGLFVKNLENVQGDERDHIIVSTTYGPDPKGKFYKRFGPLNLPGGGRRLNVLVTRAREEVHLVTSIPGEAYRAAETIPEGMTPTGGWLLFAYLRFAEELAEVYEREHERWEEAGRASRSSSDPTGETPVPVAKVTRRSIEPASDFGLSLGERLARDRGIGIDAHWGNAGFCVDTALHHPERVGDVTVGVLCDFNRYRFAEDPVHWEVFRLGILEWTGWSLHRLWTPRYFRDPERSLNEIERDAQALATTPAEER